MMKEIKKISVILSIILISGIFCGWLYGTHIVNQLMRGNIGISTFIFLPSKNMIDTYVMLNSKDELRRLEGYYAYRETGLKDFDFIYRRYKLEKSDLTRKTLIWIIEENNDAVEMQSFYKKLYEASPESLKRYLQVKINSYELIEQDIQQQAGEKK